MSLNYLRISVTDRCNLRCVYCDPLGDAGFIKPEKILRFEEIERLVRLFAECGITKVRLTGGEPLVRKNIVQLVSKIAAIPGIKDLALTTNGVLLESMAEALKAAGLMRINISVDSAERKSYEQITGSDMLEKVKRGIDKALELGFSPLKINSVIIKGINESQVLPLAQLSVESPLAVRFIEYCPTTTDTRPSGDSIPNSKLFKVIEDRFGTLTSDRFPSRQGPANYFKIKNSAGNIGFISGRSTVFCHSCNRIRLTSDGKIKPCLYSSHCYDVKELIRRGSGDSKILQFLKKILTEKPGFTKLNSPVQDFSMRKVGG